MALRPLYPQRLLRAALRALDGRIRRLRTELAEAIAGLNSNPTTLEALIRELVVALVHQFGDRHSALIVRPGDHRIRRALRHMKQSAGASLDLDATARAAGLSRPHFNTLFRRSTGLSPAVYANALRLEAAIAAVSAPAAIISAVSDDLGFSAPSNFTRFFQQHTGTGPSQFRRAVEELGPLA